MDFPSIEAFIEFLESRATAIEAAIPVGLEAAASHIEHEAREEIGHYQAEVGAFESWAPLSRATLEGFEADGIGYVPGKIELGYAPPDNPLLRTGTLRDSYHHRVEGHEAAVGSDDPIAEWQEFGTPDARFPIPPRSVLGIAACREEEHAVEMMMTPVWRALNGR